MLNMLSWRWLSVVERMEDRPTLSVITPAEAELAALLVLVVDLNSCRIRVLLELCTT